MTKVLTLFAIVCLTACTSLPQGGDTGPCASLGFCGETRKTAGLSADRTVMRMLQSPTLIGGKAADPADWPASVYAKAGDSACSATLVGERVLVMASHCMDNGGSVTFTAHANSYKAKCTHHPDYKKNDTADWALCLVDRPVTGIPFETLGLTDNAVLGQQLTLTGYGCVKPGGGGGNDGIFRVGTATVKGLPSGTTYDIVTKGGAALCFGDSGGAAYAVKQDNSRVVLGVNSRGDIDTMSYLPAFYSGTFVLWAKQWALANANVEICGLHPEAVSCRVSAPMPDGKFSVSAKAACVKGVVKPDYLGKTNQVIEAIQKTLESF